MHFNDGHFGDIHFIWWIILIAILILIFFVFYGIPYQKAKKESLKDILDSRYAKGEITKEQYEEIKRTINSKN
ncbi:SHOCT domain-containing protein [Lutibacter sp. B1]|uniref:SHOCT domain-containing protein n=1 Tax=Lutibacter sp. B1 TaxID=2725996 RepID=UPI0014568781|nr:SHOCT domain-containing protein [Lutibacter sp. B1]NLP58959.1 SHOCT domain-containing protein [Lutibacter sp. B1]